MPRLLLISSTALTIMLTACATVSTRVPEAASARIEAEKTVQTREAMKSYMKDFRRLHDIATPILEGNTQFCKKSGLDIGLYTLSNKELPKALRGKSGLRPLSSPTIVYAQPHHPRFLQGGVILGPNDKPIAVTDLKFNPNASGLQNVKIRARSETSVREFSPVEVCGYPVHLKYTPAINAYATGRSIIVTTGMMRFANDEELALIIGHELAHNTHGHIPKIILNTVAGFGRGTFARKFESEADYVGLYYSARAGYPIDNAKEFWRKLARESVRSLDKPSTHPITPDRYIRLENAVIEIKAKQAAGYALEPNRK